MELPRRKPMRMPYFDYGSNGAYFITICTKNKKMLFAPVGADSISARMVAQVLEKTIGLYDGVEVPIYTVMPNHIHAIITVARADMESAPTISHIIQTFKRYSTIEYIKLVEQGIVPPFEKQIWQRSFYDHVIRDEADYTQIWNYIEQNPMYWEKDRFYCKEELL